MIVEVSDTTLEYDRDGKLALYARHGIPEVWLCDVKGGGVPKPARSALVQRQSSGDGRGFLRPLAWNARLERSPGTLAWNARLERSPGTLAWNARLERMLGTNAWEWMHDFKT